MKKLLIALTAFLLTAATASADEVVVKDFTIKQGGTAVVEIELNNPNETYTAFQMDMLLPEGITLATGEDGEALIENGSRLGSGHTIACTAIEGGVRLVCVAAMSDAISGTGGALCTITLQANRTVAAGQSYEGELVDVYFTTLETARNRQLDDASFSITVESGSQPGDLDADGDFDQMDLSKLVNIVLNKEADYDHHAADVNQDNKVDIADVTALVNLIHE